jgi:parallel beta-helix repeat protein
MILFSVFSVVFVSGTPVKDRTKISEKHIDLSVTPPEAVKVGYYDWLKIPDASYISTPGHPMLPIKSVVVKLPLNSNVTQIVAKIENVPLTENYFIMPALTPVQAGSTEPLNMPSPDQTIYGRDELYPNEWYVYRVGNGLDPESNRRVQYVSFYFYPLRYLPTHQKILLAQHVSFTITYTEPAEEPTAQTLLKNLIITSDTLEPYAGQLATYKNSTGISSRAVNLTWVYKNYGGIDRQEQIRNCIKDFATKCGINYVTIFGDADQVPVRSVFVNDTEAGEPYVPTDLYYSDLDGTWDDNNDGIYGDRRYDNVDGIPDVYVGRIPPSLASYAQTAVDKIIGYQQQFNTSESWTQRVVLSAGTGSGDGFSNPFGIAFPFLKNYTANMNINKNIVKLYEAYGNLSTGSMASEVNKGALFVNFAGHGNPDMWLFYWVNPWLGWYNGYGIVDVQKLTNGFKLPVVTTMACSTARFDDQDCIGEWFVLQPNGGSIAYFGATRIAWGYSDQWITTGLMGEIDWRIYQNFYEGWTRLGQMWGQTAKEYVQNHIWNYEYASVYDVKTLMEFVLLGDPTIRIYNGPETLKVPSECATIQGAVNAAYNGDTIQVAQGTYYENVIVNKSLSIVGQEKGSTIIDGNLVGNVVNVTASHVSICNFTVRRSGTTWPNYTGIHISGASFGNNVSGNIITSNVLGVYFDYPSSNNTIDGNSITNNGQGICLSGSSNNSILRNNVTSNYYDGITLDSSSNYNVLRNNRMTWNSRNFGCFNNWQLLSYVNDIDTSNTVDGKPVYYWINKSNETVPVDAGYVALVNCTRMKVQGLSLTNNWQGVLLAYTKDSTITKNNMTNNAMGIHIDYSWNNTLSDNVIDANINGILLTYSSNNSIVKNSLTANSQSGIYVSGSSGNHIYGNNMNNTKQVLTFSSVNVWDDGYPSGGNYWADYIDVDIYSGPYQNETGSDGVWDQSYVIDTNNQDRYPLVNPWAPEETCLVVRGMDNRIYYRVWNGTGWEGWIVLPGSTIDSPAATVCGNELHVVVRGSDGYSLWHGYVNLTDNTFSSWTRLSGWTPSAPTLTSNGTVLCLVVRGGDNRIYYRTYTFSPRGWGGWNVIPSGATCDSPAATMLGNDLHIVVRGFSTVDVNANNTMWHIIVKPGVGVIRNWVRLSGATSSRPVLAANQSIDRLYLVVRGLDNKIYWRTYDGLPTDSWGSWVALPTGSTCDGPGATIADNKLHVVVRGSDGSTLWHRYYDFSTATYSDWKKLSGATPSPPTLTG